MLRSPAVCSLRTRSWGILDYGASLRAMRRYSRSRGKHSQDCLWLLQHAPVYTLGAKADTSQVFGDQNIAVVHTDRGGQATYHAPGQLVGYLMLDLGRLNIGVRTLVYRTEELLQQSLRHFGVDAQRWSGRPGLYIQRKKIAALGFRIHRRCSYHGFSLNVDCDLSPFEQMHPCGIAGQAVAKLCDYCPGVKLEHVESVVARLATEYFAPHSELLHTPLASRSTV
ncbi:MAG: lipoyl(octanoyl) transferase LipB [Gammaproteobacteria bacterium]